MHDKDKSDIVDEYSEIQQGSLVGRGNEVLARAEDIKGDKKKYAKSLDTPPLEDVTQGENYGGKEYHGI